MVEFTEVSVLDLVKATEFIHHIKPSLKDMMVFAIEKAQPFDRSVVFHLSSRPSVSDENIKEIFILSAEYILEHPYWRQK